MVRAVINNIMKVFIVNDKCIGSNYGIGTYISELIVALKGKGCDLSVINLNSEIGQFYYIEKEGITYWNFPSPIEERRSITKEKLWELYYINVIYLLKKHINKEDEMIFQLNYNYEYHFPRALKKAFKCKIVTCIHYQNWSLRTNGNISFFRKCIISMVHSKKNENHRLIIDHFQKEKRLYMFSDRVICLSQFTQDVLSRDYGIPINKIQLINNGLTDMRRHKNIDRYSLRVKYCIPEVPILLFVGRIEYRKGLLYALRAFKRVINMHYNCHFIIVGEGNHNLFLKECEDIWTYVTWTGSLSYNKLNELYSIADIGILPSLAEQCSYVAIEMMMHGLPIIVSTSTGLNEMVIDNYNGLHVPVKENIDIVDIDIDVFADKIEYLVKKPYERKRMGFNSRKRYEELYTSDMMGNKMIELYQSIING